MKLERWALIAEVIGGVAIVVTLIFLIFEIRGNSAAIHAAAATSISERSHSLITTSMANSALLDAIVREAQGEELSASEKVLLDYSNAANLKLAEESYIAFQQGNLDEEVWLTRAEFILDRLASEHERVRWAVRRESGWYVQGFVDYIDAELASRYGQ